MKYEERIECLIETINKSRLNDQELNMIYGVIGLSKDRNEFNDQYNTKIDKIIRERKRRDE